MRAIHKLAGITALVAGTLLLAASPLQAQTYPAKPVRVVVPFPAGGIVDILARAVTEKIAANWGSPILVEAKPGAGALIGTEAVANAAPDGYTFLVATIAGSVGPLISPQFKYDLRKSYAFAEGGSAEEFTRFLADEGARWTKLVKDANIKAE